MSNWPSCKLACRAWWRVAVIVAIGVSAATARDSLAFCRSSTCKGAQCAADAEGCPASGLKLFWRTHCIGYSMQVNGTQNLPMDKVKQAVRAAFAAWSDIDCNGQAASLTFGELVDTGCINVEFNGSGANVNVVLFRDDDWKYKNTDNTLAKAIAHFDGKTGEILDADIEVNTASNHFTITTKDAQFDLQTVLTHEVGHFIGLGHSADTDAVMYASYERGSTKGRKLTPDDIAAVCAVYPPNRPGTCNLVPKGGFDSCKVAVADTTCRSGRQAPPMTGWVALVWALAVPALWRLRRKDIL